MVVIVSGYCHVVGGGVEMCNQTGGRHKDLAYSD